MDYSGKIDIEKNSRVSAHVANDRKAAGGRGEGFRVDKRRDLRREVDTVDEDISILGDLLERSA